MVGIQLTERTPAIAVSPITTENVILFYFRFKILIGKYVEEEEHQSLDPEVILMPIFISPEGGPTFWVFLR
jgi:hypothetical protein